MLVDPDKIGTSFIKFFAIVFIALAIIVVLLMAL
jgi:hypothetical protein